MPIPYPILSILENSQNPVAILVDNLVRTKNAIMYQFMDRQQMC